MHSIKHGLAVAVAEVSAPALHHRVDFVDDLPACFPLCLLIEHLPDAVHQLASALMARLHVVVASPALGLAQRHLPPEELEPFLSPIQDPCFGFVQLQLSALQPVFQSLSHGAALAGCTEDQSPFPRPPVFAAYFAEATKARRLRQAGRPDPTAVSRAFRGKQISSS